MEQAAAGIYSELIDQAARDTGFPELKDKQKEAIMSFLQGNDIFVHCQRDLANPLFILFCL